VRLLADVSLPHLQELCVISGFRPEVDENSLFWVIIIVIFFWILEL